MKLIGYEDTKLEMLCDFMHNIFEKFFIHLEVISLTYKLKRLAHFLIFLFIASFFTQVFHYRIVTASSSKRCTNVSLINEQNVDDKVIYLTFDDGPSVVTNKILDILKEKDTKATFFLIGNQIVGFEDTVKRIHKEGHSIGLHTYTHKLKRIYRNNDNFIKEMKACSDEIKKVTGTNPNIIRFPGGSRKHLNNEFLYRLHDENFKIYDWNVQVSDGIKPKTPSSKLFREATKDTDSISPIILLMHCDYMHKNTCAALPKIIEYYKQHGYVFKPITENTTELYFPPSKRTLKGILDIMTSG